LACDAGLPAENTIPSDDVAHDLLI
jgi:hypothetical protein